MHTAPKSVSIEDDVVHNAATKLLAHLSRPAHSLSGSSPSLSSQALLQVPYYHAHTDTESRARDNAQTLSHLPLCHLIWG